MTNGGGSAKVQELVGPVVSQTYTISWERNYHILDLSELARLRFNENWTISKLAHHLGVGTSCLKERLRSLRKRLGKNPFTNSIL